MGQTTTTSGQFSLGSKDFLKGLVMAILTPVFAIVIQSLNAGALVFDWKVIGGAAVAGALAYLSKNLFSPQQIVIQNPTASDVQAVKEGAQAKVVK